MRYWPCLRAGLLVLGIGTQSGMAHALPITGNPVADGWSFQGNSLDPGTYIRGTAGWSYGVYNDVFTLGAGDAGGNWLAGDQIIGLGGKTTGQYIYWPNLVAKFGSSTASFSASSAPSPNGNGNGSFSSGMAGLGGVQVDFNYEFDGPNQSLRPGLAGTILTPDNVLYNGPHQFPNPIVNAFCDANFFLNQCGIAPDFSRLISLFSQNGSGQDILDSFEVVLDLSYLDRVYGPVPQANGLSDMAVQSFANAFTDALVSPVCRGTGPRVCTPAAPKGVAGGYQYDFDVTDSGSGDVFIPLLDPNASFGLINSDGHALVTLITDPDFSPDGWLTISELLAMGKDPAFADPAAWLEISENGDTSFKLRITSANAPAPGPIMVDRTLIDPPLPGRRGASVPEPGTLMLAGVALFGLALARRPGIAKFCG